MNNFELHEQAEQMAAGNSAYKLARRVIELEQGIGKAKAEAVRSCLIYAMKRTVVENTVYVKDIMEAIIKLEVGEL